MWEMRTGMNWDKRGLRIGKQEIAVSPSKA
jgi:hypothetical protein